MSNKIINLHNHSHYSMLDGLSTPSQIVKKSKEDGVKSVAITDHGNMNNYGDFYLSAEKEGIKPIFGNEFYSIKSLSKWNDYFERSKESNDNKKEIRKKLSRRNHLILLVKNNIGFKNMNKLTYESYKNYYYRPRIDYKLIEKYHEGLICSSACISGEIQTLLSKGEDDKALEIVNFYKNIFDDDFYLEVQFNEMEDQKKVNIKLIEIAKKNGIKVILTGDAHYLNESDEPSHQTLLLLQSKSTYKQLDEQRKKEEQGIKIEKRVFSFTTKKLFLKSYKEYLEDMKKFNPQISERDFDWMCDNTFEIDSKIEKIEIDKSIKMKDADSKIENKDDFLRDLCVKELKKRDLNEKYSSRLKFELSVIKEKKMANYFLTVNDIVKYARESMMIGCGRGSGAGSLVNYLLNITEIDPLKHNLLFERFLDISRSDPPDIDIDFENNDVVKEHLIEKFGNDAAYITNYNTFQIYGLMKDLGRVYSLETPFFFDKLNKRIKNELDQNVEFDEDSPKDITFDIAYKNSVTFHNFMEKNIDLKRDMKALLCKIKHIGRHAAGIVIADNLIEKQPTVIYRDCLQTSLTEGKNKYLSEFGFIKIDVLGLTTLKVLHRALEYSKLDYDYIHPDKIDVEDKKTFDFIFKKKNLLGVFQFETDNIRSIISRTKPECFEDLVAMNALFRPGPLKSGMAFEYGDRKRGDEEIDYYGSKIVEKILKPTYGIIIYQEQVMELGHYLGGLEKSETNTLRKMLVKVKKGSEEKDEKIEELKHKFFKGAKNNGMKIELVKKLWENMVAFSGYGFNRSHAVSYAMIAYQCSFLKTHHTTEFYCALMNEEDRENYGKISSEMKLNDIEICGIDMNKSQDSFSIINEKVYCGFSNILGIGLKASNNIMKSREKKEIKGFKDFIIRSDIDWRICNKRVVEILITIGAFDEWNNNRNLILDTYLEYNDKKNHIPKKKSDWDQEERDDMITKIFNEKKKDPKYKKEIKDSYKSAIEMKYYGFNIKYSPFSLNDRGKKIKRLVEREKAGGIEDRREYIIAAFMNIRQFKDKNENDMCFLDLYDVNNCIKPALIFSSNFKDKDIKDGGIYIVKAEVRDKVMIETYMNLDEHMNGGEE